MKRRTFNFLCENHNCLLLAKVIQHFADAAYPPGGSECAQASRETLLTLYHQLSGADASDVLAISTRQRATLRTAVNWYYQDIESQPVQQQQLLKALQSLSY